ncbi:MULTISPECIES: sugar transferase [Clostridia]|uniref:Sugar transferase n=2 Tax=Clostridia TaxID=186801 RepID=A0A8I0A4L9_9CLOT|nr:MULTISPECIES: sugar transferase [Clostridia]MBC5639030.1 sugar transferase [Clostridium lentum]MBC5653123.1 sugar transferase [Blautia lenta]OKZ87691.1 MAG: exopolysaccharide biosynthesis protein [Clostridium sp. 29_15]CDB75878.1 bacterial sugar transferase family protein [Clostridium sp. CAG:265]
MANSVRKKVYLAIKRLIDIIGSLIGIILLSPIYIIIAILIKFDSPGKIVFGHTRKGKGGKDIKVYKFRTMYSNANEIFESFTSEQKEEYYKNFKLDNDPRVTKLGGFLRKTSLDELPQLFNILKGDMTIIGPRPIVEKEISKYGNKAEKLFSVVPGLAGYWQANGRSDTTYEERVEMDMYYIDNMSFYLDVKILFQTAISVLKGEGAI